MSQIYGLVDGDTLELRYVGKTIGTLKRRLSEHKSNSKYLKEWIKENNVNILLLEETDDLDNAEVRWIKRFKSDRLFNISPGGGHGMRGLKHTDETKQKMSVASKGKSKSEEHKKNIGLALKDKPKTEEHKEKVRQGMLKYRQEHFS